MTDVWQAAIRDLTEQIQRATPAMPMDLHPAGCRCCRTDPDEQLRQFGIIQVRHNPNLPDDVIAFVPEDPYRLDHADGCPMQQSEITCTCGELGRRSAVVRLDRDAG